MTPDERTWLETHVALWGDRAATIRGASRSRADELRAWCLEGVVADLQRRLAAAPPPQSADEKLIAELEAQLARIQPYRHACGVTINDGAIMDRVRWRIEARIAEARGLPPPPMQSSVPARAEPAAPPPPPAPFTAGPQLGLFA